MMGELKFFLGFQIKQLKDGTFISQTNYTNDMLKKFDMEETSSIKRYIAPWLDLSFTFVHLGPILCLVCACVQDFKLIQKNIIWWLLREFFSI
jgi:hypothetical protein